MSPRVAFTEALLANCRWKEIQSTVDTFNDWSDVTVVVSFDLWIFRIRKLSDKETEPEKRAELKERRTPWKWVVFTSIEIDVNVEIEMGESSLTDPE